MQDDGSLVGMVVAGRFRILSLLGSGTDAVACLAQDERLDRSVVVKMLPGEHEGVFDTAKFRATARAAGRVDDKHVARLFDHGFADGRPYLVCEYIEGTSLAELLARGGPLAVPRASKILTQTAEALAACHDAHVVVGSLEPRHVMLTRGELDYVKLCLPFSTVAGFSGAPEYVAPERWEGATADYRADYYSFGVLAYELIVGAVPFRGDPYEVRAAHLRAAPPVPSAAAGRDDVPPWLDAMVLRWLSKRPHDRCSEALAEEQAEGRAQAQRPPFSQRPSEPSYEAAEEDDLVDDFDEKSTLTHWSHLAEPDFDGSFEQVAPIRKGKRALTFSATEVKTGKRVFIKLMSHTVKGDREARDRFEAEHQTISFLQDQGCPVVPLLGTGTWNECPYFVQELLPGWSLAAAMATRRRFEGAAVLKVLEGCLAVLARLHQASVIHCDVSPENIFVVTEEEVMTDGRLPDDFEVRIVDLESAIRVESPEDAWGHPFVGKPSYVAPWLVRGSPISPDADLYSVGVVCYELLVGARPYVARSYQAAKRITDVDIRPMPSSLAVPSLMQQTVRSLLHADPERRFSSAAEAAAQVGQLRSFQRWLSGGVDAPARGAGPGGALAAPEHVRAGGGVERLPLFGLQQTLGGRATWDSERLRRFETSSRRFETSSRRFELSSIIWSNADSNDSDVQFSVFARSGTVQPGTQFLLDVWAYHPRDRPAVLEMASDAGPIFRGQTDYSFDPDNPRFVLVLDIARFGVDDPRASMTWTGGIANASFLVDVAAELPPGAYPGQVKVLLNGVLLSRLVFELMVTRTAAAPSIPGGLPGLASDLPSAAAPQDTQRGQQEHRVYSAFASYASEDREEVIRRVQMAADVFGVDVFVDVVSLRSGEQWEKKLRSQIRNSDVLYLFWSTNASCSRWVEMEWRYALEQHGLDGIHPIPLEDPRQVPPPSELQALHFNSMYLAYLTPPQPKAHDRLGGEATDWEEEEKTDSDVVQPPLEEPVDDASSQPDLDPE